MSVVDLHPEELLDRDAAGTLSVAERARLEAHLASCAACRFERAARDDFAEEMDARTDDVEHPEELLDRDAHGTLTPGERTRIEAHLAACAACRFERQARLDFAAEMAAAPVRASRPLATDLSQPTPAPTPVAEVLVLPRAKRSRLVIALLAAAATLVVGVAGAAGVVQVLGLRVVPMPAPSATTTPLAPQPRRAPTAIESPAPVVSAADVAPLSPPATDAPTVLPTTSVPTSALPLPAARAATGAARSLEAPARAAIEAPIVPVPDTTLPIAPAPPVTPAATKAEVATLFSEANDARRRGDVERAISLYRDLDRRFPDSDEAKVARATAGRLLLERGDANGALARFDSYLRDKGPLAEEALVGRARSLQRLGRASEEAEAWSTLLRTHPDTAHADEARARLAELGKGGRGG